MVFEPALVSLCYLTYNLNQRWLGSFRTEPKNFFGEKKYMATPYGSIQHWQSACVHDHWQASPSLLSKFQALIMFVHWGPKENWYHCQLLPFSLHFFSIDKLLLLFFWHTVLSKGITIVIFIISMEEKKSKKRRF